MWLWGWGDRGRMVEVSGGGNLGLCAEGADFQTLTTTTCCQWVGGREGQERGPIRETPFLPLPPAQHPGPGTETDVCACGAVFLLDRLQEISQTVNFGIELSSVSVCVQQRE
jgi:hypothetical protein